MIFIPLNHVLDNPVSVSASEIGFARAFVRLALERRYCLVIYLNYFHSDLLQALINVMLFYVPMMVIYENNF